MFYCADIDECAVRNGNCPSESTCVNNVGSYVCVCDSGYRREGSRCVGQWLISAQFLVFFTLYTSCSGAGSKLLVWRVSPPFFPFPPLPFFLFLHPLIFPALSSPPSTHHLPSLFPPSFPSPSLHSSPSLRNRFPLFQLEGLGERYKLSQRGLGQSPSRNRFWCILALKSDIWCHQF